MVYKKERSLNIKLRLTIMQFFQFFLWGAWLITFGAYASNTLKLSGTEIGAIYGTMGMASIFMPAIVGIIADRWINAEKVYGTLHVLGGIMLFIASQVNDANTLYWVMLLNSIVYMPSLAMSFSVAYSILTSKGLNVVTDYPPIRVWGTVGFIVAMWITSLLRLELSSAQLYIGSVSALFLGIYSFTLPACPPGNTGDNKSLLSSLGLDAFVLFKQTKMAIFFIFAMLLGAALQITNTFGDAFLHDFARNPLYQQNLAVKYPAILLSISQMSETLFILAIPFCLKKFGIKKVMLISMFAWVFRFGLFAFGNPGNGLWMLILSMIVYGCAFDFFNISGSLFVETETSPNIRASAQGLFIIMTNGIGAFIGARASGLVIDYFTTTSPSSSAVGAIHGLSSNLPMRDWHSIWLTFAGYSLVTALLFIPIFKYKHTPQVENKHSSSMAANI